MVNKKTRKTFIQLQGEPNTYMVINDTRKTFFPTKRCAKIALVSAKMHQIRFRQSPMRELQRSPRLLAEFMKPHFLGGETDGTE